MPVILHSLDELISSLTLHDGMSVSFHHHLRNGDRVINPVLEALEHHGVKRLHIHASSIFPAYTKIADLLSKGIITDITTSYINGPVADVIADIGIAGTLKMQTHGGRARSIMNGETVIDIAFIAAPAVNKIGHVSGTEGPSACGSLGYAIADLVHAKTKVLITNHLVDHLEDPQIDGVTIDYILVRDSIGDASGIVSGTTAVTNDPVGLKIAKNASELIVALGVLKQGFSYQSGAGGISLRVTENIRLHCKRHHIKAAFFSGGITKTQVDMLEEGLVDKLYDVQCFDLAAVSSLRRNKNHLAISADQYANPANPNRVTKNLDIVILGAAETDLDFNVNVTTDSTNTMIGGSGGHSDTASDARISIIVTPLMKARNPIIKTRVNTITTRGEHIDAIVTERGIAINPKRQDLLALLAGTNLDIVTIEELQHRAHRYTGVPVQKSFKGLKIGVVEDRDGTLNDTLHKKR